MVGLPRSRDERFALGLVVAAAVVVRLAFAAYAARSPAGLHDPGFYRYLASSLAAGDGYRYGDGPTAYYPVGYPALLGALAWVVHHTPLPDTDTAVVVGLNVIAAAVAVVATYVLARRWLSERRALVAAGIMALLPNLVFHGAVALSEPLFLALFVPALVLLVAPDAVRGGLVAGGVLLGLATLTRPVALPLLAVFPFAWRAAGVPWRAALLRAGVVVAVTVAVVAPWVVRNVVVMDSATLSTNTGDNLCMSRQPGADGGFQLSDFCHGGVEGLVRPAYETTRDANARDTALRFVRDEPLREVSLWPRRLLVAFEHDHEALRAVESYGDDPFLPSALRTSLQVLAGIGFFGLLAGAAAAVARWWRDDRAALALLGLSFLAVVVVPVVAFFGDPRFHVPGVPLLAVLAAGLGARPTAAEG